MQHIHTEIIAVDPVHPEPQVIERAAKLLREGEIVVFPTETVYGLGAGAFQTAALERIFAAKGRPFNDPLIVYIASEQDLEQVTPSLPEQARRLAQVFWPGPLTLILRRGPRVPGLVTAGLKNGAIPQPPPPLPPGPHSAVCSPNSAPRPHPLFHVHPPTAPHRPPQFPRP